MTEVSPLQWVKSTYSDNGGTCVEWSPSYANATGIVPLRDSKRADGPVLRVSTAAFAGLVVGLKARNLGTI
ncbi:DUF397 domain-containing protein [Streptomyces qinzhouensis]|uniref:DUF397 domain-containing protein n=1 Tax=Streptomyces qinzhouensis TaxID=2599401 RepID=A0A5B8J7Y6_9ACTN|nr:DUF397 domain-containing protein [Streptomyces qinzhouensis]QDY77376.1 DUF397 domain-containing protein [Streptomyces qinzhouensis]